MKHAQIEFGAIISIIVFAAVVIPMLMLLGNALKQNQCAEYISQIDSLNNKIASLEQNSAALRQQLNVSEERYYLLITNNVTKKDIWDLQNQINQTRGEIVYLKNEVNIMNTNTITAYNTIIKNYRIAIIFNILLSFFFVLDLTLLSFQIDIKKHIIDWIKHKISQIRAKIQKKKDE